MGLWPKCSVSRLANKLFGQNQLLSSRLFVLKSVDIKTYSEEFAGKKLFVEIGRLAGQANGSCRVQYGDSTVLVTATMSAHPKKGDYFPLSVDYEEKYYAAGKIKGSKWIKRETRPSEEAILTSRVIDRSIRPRFDHNIRNEVQVVPTVLTFDGVNDPDIVALFGASLALMISDIPFAGPVAGVRVGRIDGKLIINPTYAERAQSDFDIIVAVRPHNKFVREGQDIISEEEISVAQVQERIRNHTRDAINKSQNEFYLREQLKSIKKELGENDDDAQALRSELEAKNLLKAAEEFAVISEEAVEAWEDLNKLFTIEKFSDSDYEALINDKERLEQVIELAKKVKDLHSTPLDRLTRAVKDLDKEFFPYLRHNFGFHALILKLERDKRERRLRKVRTK